MCNRDKIRQPTVCHICRAAFDHMGNEVGNYNGSACVNIEDDRFLEECPLEYDHCETVTTTDWNVEGSQMYILRRECGRTKVDQVGDYTSCSQGQSKSYSLFVHSSDV